MLAGLFTIVRSLLGQLSSWYSLLLFLNQSWKVVFNAIFNCARIIIELHIFQQSICFSYRAGTSFSEFYVIDSSIDLF